MYTKTKLLPLTINPTLVTWDFQTWLVTLGVCAPNTKKVYRVNYTTFSLVQDIFTNTIKHFDVCVTRFMEIIHYRYGSSKRNFLIHHLDNTHSLLHYLHHLHCQIEKHFLSHLH